MTQTLDPAESIAHVLTRNEHVLWSGRPKLAPFVLPSLVMTLLGVVWLSFPTAMFVMLRSDSSARNEDWGVWAVIVLVPFFLIGAYMLLAPFLSALQHRSTNYFITNERIIVTGGIVGRHVNIFNLRNVNQACIWVSADSPLTRWKQRGVDNVAT